ncbi:MAG: hypothetical protein FWB97_03795 [Oscillospiraceae bacterium]|nr:hypothetical protein [Oscillospiraceae bacterium]
MAKAQHLIETINSRFSHLRGECVVIYGMGQLATTLAENKDSLAFLVVGVMDRDKTEGEFAGIPIVTTENISDVAKTIIIAALGSSCAIIYDRISILADKGIDIYFPDGEKRSARVEAHASEYYITLHKQLTELIEAHDIISFDVFDTLVMRKCLFPAEVFKMLEDLCEVRGFAEIRAGAAVAAETKLGRLATIYDIYEHMGLKGIRAEDEIALEKEMLTARRDIAVFYEHALKSGKTVILTSDMHLPQATMREMLAQCGIAEYEALYVSCEHNLSKSDGSIWGQICNNHQGQKILHVGDNKTSDYVSNHPISSFLIKSTVEAADILGFGQAIASAKDYRDYSVIGTSLAKLLTLDMTFVDENGKIVLKQAEDVGYCFLAPQTLGFVNWLARTAAANGESQLYFCARDTYMFMRIYEKIRRQHDAPPAQYMYISKRVLCGILADDLPNIKKSLEYYYARFDSKTTVGDALFKLFGAEISDNAFAAQLAKEVSLEALLVEIEKSYLHVMRENAEKERANFFAYIAKAGIDTESAAIVDYICGKSVRLAEKLFEASFYLYGCTDPNMPINESNGKVKTWLEKPEDMHLPHYNIMKHSQFGESAYSSPEGTCVSFDGSGTPVLDDEEIDFSVNEKIAKGVEAFRGEMDYTANCETADRVFGAMFSGNFAFEDAVSKMKWSSYTANK